MYTRAELKQNAKNALKGKWGSVILAIILSVIVSYIVLIILSVIRDIFVSIVNIELFEKILILVSLVVQIVLTTPITVGLYSFFIKLSETNKPEVREIFRPYNESCKNSMKMGLLIYFYTFLWSLVFIIPGIIKSYSYSMAYYIMAENPTMSAEEAITKSMEMMNGHKAELFFLQLSFFGWGVLAYCTCGIGYLWLTPYMNKTTANFYQAIKGESVVANV